MTYKLMAGMAWFGMTEYYDLKELRHNANEITFIHITQDIIRLGE